MFRRIRTESSHPHQDGLMLGLGETTEELLDTLCDLVDAGCEMLTLGQYLQPSPEQLPVVRHLPPEEFDALAGARGGRVLRSRRRAGPLELSCGRHAVRIRD